MVVSVAVETKHGSSCDYWRGVAMEDELPWGKIIFALFVGAIVVNWIIGPSDHGGPSPDDWEFDHVIRAPG
jgi:hypothetical protein